MVSYQPRLFIAKCCCQQRWRPPACWRWMWMWHKILMSNSTQHRASNTAVPAFVTPHFFGPGTGHGIIFGAVRYARQWLCYYPCPFVISAYYFRPPLIHQRYLHNTHRCETLGRLFLAETFLAGCWPVDLRLKLAIPDIFTTTHFPHPAPVRPLKCIPVL